MPIWGAARCSARRDRDGDLCHPYPSRPFARGAEDQGSDRRDCVRRGPAPAARPLDVGEAKRLDASADIDFRPDVGTGWYRGRHRQWLDDRSADHARAHGKPYGLCAEGSRPDLFRRSCDGLVDVDRGAARRRDERLYGFIGKARAAKRADLPAPGMAGRYRTRRVSCRAISATGRRARFRSCGGLPRAPPISPRWCGRSYRH